MKTSTTLQTEKSSQKYNRISLERHRGDTWVTELGYHSPLRVFEVGRSRHGSPCQLVLSNHGGGMLQGDEIRLNFQAGPLTKSVIRSQANTQILNNPSGSPSVFELEGRLGKDCSHQFLSEPVVMHTNAIYHSHQRWDLEPRSRLILVDWFQSGRSDSGEAFGFQEYRSSIHVTYAGESLLRERFRVLPKSHQFRANSAFSRSNHFFTAFCLGDFPQELIDKAAPPQNEHTTRTKAWGSGGNARDEQLGPWISANPIPGGFMIRALGVRRADFEEQVTQILKPFLAHTENS